MTAVKTLLVGVIGHVDHGKTALVRALTGIETDRLKEERARGVSIVPGFALLSTGNGEVDLVERHRPVELGHPLRSDDGGGGRTVRTSTGNSAPL